MKTTVQANTTMYTKHGQTQAKSASVNLVDTTETEVKTFETNHCSVANISTDDLSLGGGMTIVSGKSAVQQNTCDGGGEHTFLSDLFETQ